MINVVHLVSNNDIGGVTRGIDSMATSELSKEYTFDVNDFSNGVDIIIWHDAVGTKSLINLLKLRLKYPTKKIIIHEHHYSEWYEKFNPPPNVWRFHTVARLCFSLVNRVVSCSLANRQWILNNNLAGKDKVVAIPSYNSHLKEILEVPMKSIGEKKIFAFYGRSSRQKGIETLLKAIAIANSPNAEFIVQLLNTTPELEGLIEELNLHKRSNIHFIRGPVNVPALLSNCDVVIIPSRWEPFGQVALEAKAAGKHIIASEVDGLVEQLDNLGVLLPVEDSNALANAIIDTSFADVQYLETKGQEARSQAQEAYKAYVKNWQDALSSV